MDCIQKAKEERELRVIIIKFANLIRPYNFFAYNSFNRQWREKVNRLKFWELKRQLRCLLSMCGNRRIAQSYNSLFKNSKIAFKIVGEYIKQRKFDELHVFRPLMESK